MIELIILGSIQLAIWGTIGVYRTSRSIRRRWRRQNGNVNDSDSEVDVEFYTTPSRRRINEPLPKYELLDPMFHLTNSSESRESDDADSTTLPSYDELYN